MYMYSDIGKVRHDRGVLRDRHDNSIAQLSYTVQGEEDEVCAARELLLRPYKR